MFFDAMELYCHKILSACGIERIRINITQPILIIIGDNGSGKSSLLKEFTPWPAIQTSYNKGNRKLFLTHNDKKYTIGSDFKKGINHTFVLDDEELNTGNTGILQKELCEQHFNLNPFINSVINMSFHISKMIPTERRNLFFNAYPFMNEVLEKHKKIVSIIRSLQTNLKMLSSRKTELLAERMNDSDFDKIQSDYRKIKQQLNHIEKYLYSLGIETNKLKEVREQIKSSPFYREIFFSELKNLYIQYSRSLNSISLNLNPKFKNITDHTNTLNDVKTERTLSEYQQKNLETSIHSLKEDIDKYQSYLNSDLEEERVVLLKIIETSTKVIETTFINRDVPIIDEETINRLTLIIPLLENHLLYITQCNGKIHSQQLIGRIQSRIQTYSLFITDGKRKIEFFERELVTLREKTFHLPPDDCFHLHCKPKQLLVTEYEKVQKQILSLIDQIELLKNDAVKYHRRLDKLTKYIDASLMCEESVRFIDDTFHLYSWKNYIFNHKTVLDVINNQPFTIVNRVNVIIKNSQYQLLINEHTQKLKDSHFRLSLIEKTPSRQMIDSALLDRKTQLEKQLVEYREIKSIIQEKDNDIRLLSSLKNIRDEWVLLKQQWDVYSEFRITDETVKWNEEQMVYLKSLKNELTDKLVQIETVVQKQNNINIRLSDEIEPSIEKIQDELKRYKLVESALSPATGIPKPHMIEFINEIIKDTNYFISAILTMDDLEILPIEKDIESVTYTFPCKRNDYPISDISDCSKAQKNIIDLCWNLALYKQLGLNNNYPLIMDEPDDGYSDGNRTRLLMLLSSLVEEGLIHQLILVSHFASTLSGFVNSDIVCLAEDNILLPLSFNSCCQIN